MTCHSKTAGESADYPGLDLRDRRERHDLHQPHADEPGFGGPWTCVYDDVGGVTCTSTSSGGWNCAPDGDGNTTCVQDNPETPDGGAVELLRLRRQDHLHRHR